MRKVQAAWLGFCVRIVDTAYSFGMSNNYRTLNDAETSQPCFAVLKPAGIWKLDV